jgi:outer membrane protein OmpA-like peptidoglycan-associated protein
MVGDEQLQTLAALRAQRVKNALKEAGVDDARMFITQVNIHPGEADTKNDQDGKDGKGRLSRVQFTLK